MTGAVNADLEAIIRLTVQGSSGQSVDVEAIIDTGFSGYLTLPPSLIAALGLPWVCRQHGLLADGSLHVFDVYEATVLWDGRARVVEIEAVDAQPLLGMRMLYRSELRIEVVDGGAVAISALP
jgi:clan AA aspartic protease